MASGKFHAAESVEFSGMFEGGPHLAMIEVALYGKAAAELPALP
ncbi:hypothetical protein [Cupriavidus pinatubonensis]|uniref:Uncharacterized protein n=1 Tax=Cupriavidus pinatubonensis TaxID=248026 RepID=A0ABN7XSD7_9BURK|nr:hypothetical protein [Cupriavidus pinatubonensis]CAG9163914.1 hypothetical protein LMG23994_00338 [Cupriavidus pinatubonensis]